VRRRNLRGPARARQSDQAPTTSRRRGAARPTGLAGAASPAHRLARLVLLVHPRRCRPKLPLRGGRDRLLHGGAQLAPERLATGGARMAQRLRLHVRPGVAQELLLAWVQVPHHDGGQRVRDGEQRDGGGERDQQRGEARGADLPSRPEQVKFTGVVQTLGQR
jgi:hypothetical protein